MRARRRVLGRPAIGRVSGKRGNEVSRVQYLTRLRLEPLEDRRMLTVFLVDSLADTVADDGMTTLREALQAANTNTELWGGAVPAGSATETDVIRFAESLFTDGENPVPGRITLGGTQLEITDSVSIEGPGANLLTIDADGVSRVFYVNSPIVIGIHGITISGGVADYYGTGGGVYINRANVTISHSIIRDNWGIVAGGIWVGSQSTTTILDSIIENNVAIQHGGGVSLNGTSTITRTTIAHNSAGTEAGGLLSYGNVVLTDSIVRENRAGTNGGGIANYGLSLKVVNSFLSKNTALNGGGIYIWNGNLHATNATVVDNIATEVGGAIYSRNLITVTNTTIAHNSASEGGGLWMGGGLTLRNSVVAKNASVTSHPDIGVADGGVYYCSNNLVGIWENGVPPGPNSVWGTPAEPLDPRLTAITNEDGNILFYRPHANSPAVDAGDNALAVDTDGNPLTTDMLGNARIVNGTVDLGSVELATSPELVVTMTPAIELNEGDTCVVHVSLTALPSAPTTVTIAKRDGDTDSVTVDATTLVFDETNWDIPQPVEVAAVVDADPYHELVVFSFAAEGMDTVRIRVTAVDEVSRPYVVNSLEDVVAVDGRLTLREAIEAANTNKAVGDAWAGSSRFVDAITFAPELAGGTIVLSGMQLEILDDLVIQGIGADQLAVSGNNASRVFYIGEGVTATIDSLEITGGYAPYLNYDGTGNGGGIYNAGVLTVANSRVAANVAEVYGGGVYNTNAATLVIANSTIVGNEAKLGGGLGNGIASTVATGQTTIVDSIVMMNRAKDGGGVFNLASLSVAGSTISENSATGRGGGLVNEIIGATTIANSTISNNHAQAEGGGAYNGTSRPFVVTDSVISGNSSEKGGGGICVSGILSITNSLLEDNTAGWGGGIFVQAGSATLTGSAIMRNSALSGGGGGVQNSDSLTVVDCIVAHNWASSNGGGLGNSAYTALTILDSSIVNNTTQVNGAGVHIDGLVTTRPATIVNSTIAHNMAKENGGGIYARYSTPLITCATIVSNSAGISAGGFFLDNANAKVANSIIASNESPSIADVSFLSGTLTAGSDYNLIGVWSEALLPGEHSVCGTIESPLNPVLARITDAMGLILHYRPLSTSPAVDAGGNALAIDPEGIPLVTDALGQPRIVGAAVDIGAVELSNQPRIGVLPMSTTDLIEGETVDVQVVLTAPPFETVTVRVDQEPASGVGIVTRLTFGPNDWNVPQTITIVAREDDDRRNESVLFSFTATGIDAVYLPVTVKDNDPQVYVVNSLEDIVAEDGLLTLREALEAANTNRAVGDAPAGCEGFADMIMFAPDLFTDGAEPVARAIVLIGGQLELLDNVEIRGPGAELLTIDADGLSRVFYVGPRISAAIDGLKITGGSAQDTDPGDANDRNGGGIYLDREALLSLTTSRVVENTAARYGGGIYAQTFCTISIADSTIANNAASSCGGIRNDGGSIMNIVRSTISGNVNGGIANSMSSKLVISDSTVSHNTAGGIANSYFSTLIVAGSVVSSNGGSGIYNGATLTVADSIIVSNSAENGAGLHNTDQGTTTISGSTISRNTATSYGGGVYNLGTMAIIDSNISENAAAYGGGASANGSGVVTLNNTLVEDNTASTHGGGIYVRPGCEAILIDSPVAGNTAPRGGGVYNWGRTTVDGARFTDNSATYGGGIFSRAVLTLDNSELADNSATHGGGLYADEPSMITITNSTLSQNSATTSGGAIHSLSQYYPVNITDSVFTQNSAPSGGGIYNDQGFLVLTGSTFDQNSSSTSGGGVFNKQGTLTVADSTFTANTSNNLGGAIHNEPNSTTTVAGSAFSDNSARNRGGAVYNLGALSVDDSTFINNSGTASGAYGGAVGNYNGATATITGSTFHGNRAVYGGAVFGYQNTTVVVANSAFSGNYARTSGGGLFSHGASTLTVVNSTIAGNTAGTNGGGIYSYTNCQLTLQNSIVAMNTAPSMPNILGSLTAASSHNQVGGEPRFVRNPDDGGDGWHDNPATLDFDESTNNDYGDLRLRFNSPAINAGSNALAVGPDGSPLTVDVAGQPRIVYDVVDLGAHEFQAVTLLGDANGDNAVNELDAAILASNWGKSGMTWADGDFNNDGRVNAIDAAILAAHFGTTFTPPAGEATAAAATKTPSTAAAPLVGPLPDGGSFLFRQPIEPARRTTIAETPAGAADAMRLGMRLVAPMETMPSDQQGTYALRSPEELLIETTAELSAAALDTALAEEYGAAIEPTSLLNGHAGWSRMVARRQSNRRDTGDLGRAELAVDLLMAGR